MEKPTSQLEEWEKIERYWTGKLSPDEKAAFEKNMIDDERLYREATALQVGVQAVEEAILYAHARQTIKRLQKTNRQKQNTLIQWGSFTALAIAASIGFIIYLAFAPVQFPSPESDVEVLREFRPQYQSDSTEALTLRQKQAFDRFYEGQSFLSEGQPELAARQFEQVLRFEDIRPYFREAAQWHLVICYLKIKQPVKAEKYYLQLAQTSEYKIDRLERWKVWWHIRRLTRFS